MADSSYNHFLIEDRSVAIVLTLVDPKLFDTLLVAELDDELIAYVDGLQPHHLVINFRRVTQCSTAVINSVLRAKKRLVARNGAVKLCGMNDAIRSAYRMLNLDGTVFNIYDDVEAAIAAF